MTDQNRISENAPRPIEDAALDEAAGGLLPAVKADKQADTQTPAVLKTAPTAPSDPDQPIIIGRLYS